MKSISERREILDGMLAANLICFQTYSYARHFSSSCIRVCGYETAASANAAALFASSTKGKHSSAGMGIGIDNQGHITNVAHCAVGVDAARVERDV